MKKKNIILYLGMIITLLLNQFTDIKYITDINPIMILNKGASKWVEVQGIILWFIGYMVLAFYFFGHFKSNLQQYGYIEIVKSKSKIYWLNNRMKILFKIVIIYTLIIQIFNILLNSEGMETLNISEYILSIILYILTISALLVLQGILEVCFNEEHSLLISMIFTVSSVVFGGILYEIKEFPYLIYILLPNNGMSLRNNILQPLDFGINPIISLGVLISFNIGLYLIFRSVLKRKDII